MKVLIITGGNIDRDFAFSFLKEQVYEEIIAVDGGLAFAEEAGLIPTHLVGDFDTISSEILKNYLHRAGVQIHQFNPEKDYTDTDIAMKLAVEILAGADGEKVIHILGGTGSRMDHVMANLQMLRVPLEAGIQAVIADKNNRIQMIQGKHILKKEGLFGKYMSLIPATPVLRGITLKGFKYPLDRAKTCFGESLCVSNELVEAVGEIQIEEGKAWVILSRD